MEPICGICGEPITEVQMDAEEFIDTALGIWHKVCIDQYEDDRDGRAADHQYDLRYDR